MYSPGIPWHVLNVSTLAEPSQSLSQWLCALQQQDSPAGGWAQGRLRSAGGQVLPPELREEHSLSWAQHKTKPNHTKTRASGLQTSHEQVREACGRGLSRGCALLSIQAAPPQCLPLPLPAVCLSRELCPCVWAGSAGAGTAPPIPPGHCLLCLCLALWELSNSPALGQDGLAELLFRVGSLGMFLPGETAPKPFTRGHVKPQPSLTLPSPHLHRAAWPTSPA